MTTFVLLRGLAREAGHWGDVARRLRRRLGDGADVIALDLPGNGLRHREDSAATVDGLLASVAPSCSGAGSSRRWSW